MNEPPRHRVNGYPLSRNLDPKLIPIASLAPLGRELRKHSPAHVRKLAASLERFGFVCPVIIDPQRRVVAGWGLILAAGQLGLTEVPAVTVSDLTEGVIRALRLTLNRLAEDSEWDEAALKLEISEILQLEPEIDLEVTGFEMGEVDSFLEGRGLDQEDELPVIDVAAAVPVTSVGDLWLLNQHRVYCGDALEVTSYERLMRAEKAQMVFTDPPYNVPIEQNVSGLGVIKHADFAMASGELTPAEYRKFLEISGGHMVRHSADGTIHFVCMDWRHLNEMLLAGTAVYTELKNLCVWNKSNAGMGSLYRSKHELVFVFKSGTATHINNVALGRHGRNRTNVWDYVSQSSLNGTSKSKLALHPTVKPVAMVADAILDCSNRGGIILDPFGGAGTTMIAAEKTGRKARLIEIDPIYVDVIVERWQRLTGAKAIHADTGQLFTRSGATDAQAAS